MSIDAPAPERCAGCGSDVPPGFLVCPVCRRLVHGRRLDELARAAEAAEAAGDLRAALEAWRAALALLPPTSRQSVVVSERVAALSARVPETASSVASMNTGAAETAANSGGASGARFKQLGVFGVALALLLKLKVPLLFVLGKGKLLLGGLTQTSTLLSMLASLGVYWSAWGWRFAGGLLGVMYVHEMGHVAALQRLGIAASAPMFVPGLGAFVRMKQYPASPAEDARVGLAGPLWGLAASLAALAVYAATGAPFWAGVAHAGAWLNLFNLLPLGPLDGGRGFRALSRGQRGLVCAVLGLAWVATRDGLALLLALVAVVRTLGGGAPARPDRRALADFVLLVAGLSVVGVLSAAAGAR